jgi:uracil-DNA glycosylase
MCSFIDRIATARIGETVNFYRCGRGAALRKERLAAYLEARAAAPWLLVGEAPGYRGARVSGIPFTSERQLTGRGPAEATATIVQRVLAELGLLESVLLWNVVPTHPGTATSNRRPTRLEVEVGREFAEELACGRDLICVGRIAQEALGGAYVRHPSHGGAQAFARMLATIVALRTPVRFSSYEDVQRQTGRDSARLGHRRRLREDPGAPRDADRRPPARKGQAPVHAARRHG